jgi:hypothetical protein
MVVFEHQKHPGSLMLTTAVSTSSVTGPGSPQLGNFHPAVPTDLR